MAAPSKSSACRRASDAMKAGVSPQADDMHKILKYMGVEYSTAWERKIAMFEKKQGKKAEKVVKKTEKIVKKEKSFSHQRDEPSVQMMLTYDFEVFIK